MNLALVAGIAIIVVLLACVFAFVAWHVGLRTALLTVGAMFVIFVLIKIASGLIEFGLMQQ